MRLKSEQIKRIAHLILEKLEGEKALQIQSTRDKVLLQIEKVITADMKAEDDLEIEAEKMLKQYAQASGDIDKVKMLAMIKKELIKKNKIVL